MKLEASSLTVQEFYYRTPILKPIKRQISQLFQLPRLDMSTGGAFGGNRGLRPIPPEKGIFPLDHLHECDAEKKEYLVVLSLQLTNLNNVDISLRNISSVEWLSTNLMAKQDMAELGFSGVKELDSTEDKNTESIEH
ncbi:hypothetical protein AXX17_AT1G63870 [Arabidopsis thaliana]|uniref:Uncharacterized protein n=1 Tax=Arabidopsis thaliana TaxID=3702 RepID=A0A178W7Z4_ARATH|nr:hypothetical protein AXX17_AT1G63870 [Arabidopsis thaliana]